MDEESNFGISFPDPGMIANNDGSGTGMRARDPWEMEQLSRYRTTRPYLLCKCRNGHHWRILLPNYSFRVDDPICQCADPECGESMSSIQFLWE